MPPKTRRKLTRPLSSKYHPIKPKSRKARIPKQAFVVREETKEPTQLIPVESRNRRQCEYKWKEYNVVVDVLGKGVSAKVYALCDEKKQCPYVMRIEEFPSIFGRGEAPRQFVQHTIVAKLASNNHIGPKLHDSWICFDEAKNVSVGLMVMDRWDGDLRSFKEHETQGDEIVAQVEMKMKKLHQLGYVHGDIWLGNVLFRQRGNKTEIALVDFNDARAIDSFPDVFQQELDAIEYLKHWDTVRAWTGYDNMFRSKY